MSRLSFFLKTGKYQQAARRLFAKTPIVAKRIGIKLTRPRWKLIPLSFAVILLVAELATVVKPFYENSRYDLAAAKALVTPTADHLRAKIRYDQKQGNWLFNENAQQELAGISGEAAKVGGARYSAELPLNANTADGLKLSDARNKLDISFKPNFKVGDGKLEEGYLVYPLRKNDAQLVYTFAQDGVKEDIILHSAAKDTASFSYSLSLPDGLEARLQSDGSVGIFGGDATLFGNISYGSDKDRALVEKARKNSKKTTLYYVIPAPVVKGDDINGVKADFVLDGDKLTVKVSGLKSARYPLSIDPSFVMDTSSCTWRKGGNNEDGSMSYTGCQLGRNLVSGATIGSWTQSTSAATGNLAQVLPSGIVAYNGYLYTVSSETGAGAARLVYYAPINASTGAVGQFVATTSTNADRRNSGIVIYNGYIYALGGVNVNNTTEYAKINSDGSVGAWTAGTNLNVGRLVDNAAVAYNGRLYVVGGCSAQALFCTGVTNVTEYATIRGDGSLSAWTASTSAATGHLPTAVLWHTVVTGNGYLYSIGGQDTGGAGQNAINYVAIKSDGSLGTWASAGVALPVNLRGSVAVIHNNYLYVMGGNRGGDSTTTQNITYVAKIYADGRLGPLQQTTAFTTARTSAKATTYNGRIYIGGGQSDYGGAPTTYQDTQYTTVSTSPGDISPFATETDTLPGANGGVNNAATVFYGGYMYLVGGNEVDSGALTNKVRYAKLNADGSTGAWAQTSAFTDARTGMAAAAYNGYMYMAGGHELSGSGTANCVDTGLGANYCRDIQYAPINSDGTLGAWASAGGVYAGTGNTGRGNLGMAIYNGYVYVMGGNYNNNSSVSAEVDVAPINANGTVGTWTQNPTGMGSFGRSNSQLVQAGPYIYFAGGRQNSGGNQLSTVVYATLSSNGGISAWASAGPDFTGGRAFNVAAAANGYLYVSTGELSWYNDVQYIKINMSNGTLSGSWTTSSVTVPIERANGMGGIYNGYLYVAGGCRSFTLGNCNSPINTLSYAQIYNGGGGITGAWTTNSTSLNTARYNVNSVVSNSYLYVLSGLNNGNGLTSVEYAPINPDGSLGTFNTTSSINNTYLQDAGYVAYNGYIYKTGGITNNAVSNSVQYAAVCTGTNVTTAFTTNCTTSSTPGTLSSWAFTANSANNGTTQSGGFNTARGLHVTSVYNGYLYIAGGCSSTTGFGNSCNGLTTSVESAPINADGTIGAWTAVGNFTTGRYGSSGMIYNGYLYVVGGCTGWDAFGNCNAYASDLQYAQVTVGTLASDSGCGSTWCYGPSMEKAGWWYRNALSVSNGYMYLLGVENQATVPANTQYAPIYANGLLGKWQGTSTSYTTNRFSKAALSYNGNLYVIGGCNNNVAGCSSSQMADVQYAGLQVTSHITRHSMLLTTDARTLPANFFATVTPQNGASSVNASVSTANDPAVVLNNLGTNRQITSATKYQLLPGNDGTKYYWLTVTLDDSQSMVWGETSGSTVSYLQLNYVPNPGLRLRGGKTFNDNIQQSLDAP